jgi:hypothetical protein
MNRNLAARLIWTLIFSATLVLLPNIAMAQTGVFRQQAKPSGWGARIVLRPIIFAHGGFTALCNSRAAQLDEQSVDKIDRLITPTPSQRAILDELKVALGKATDLSSGSCPGAIPQNSQARLEFTEQRLGALHEAVKTVSVVFDALYGSLSDDQRNRIDAGPRRWRWPRLAKSQG